MTGEPLTEQERAIQLEVLLVKVLADGVEQASDEMALIATDTLAAIGRDECWCGEPKGHADDHELKP